MSASVPKAKGGSRFRIPVAMMRNAVRHRKYEWRDLAKQIQKGLREVEAGALDKIRNPRLHLAIDCDGLRVTRYRGRIVRIGQESRAPRTPRRGLLVSVTNPQHGLLVERLADDLQGERQSPCVESVANAKRRPT